jgi:hypothetical protein
MCILMSNVATVYGTTGHDISWSSLASCVFCYVRIYIPFLRALTSSKSGLYTSGLGLALVSYVTYLALSRIFEAIKWKPYGSGHQSGPEKLENPAAACPA